MAAWCAKEMIVLDQEHGDAVHIIGVGERPRAGDGLVLVEPGVIGVIKTVDCLPVILYAPGYPVCRRRACGLAGNGAPDQPGGRRSHGRPWRRRRLDEGAHPARHRPVLL